MDASELRAERKAAEAAIRSAIEQHMHWFQNKTGVHIADIRIETGTSKSMSGDARAFVEDVSITLDI